MDGNDAAMQIPLTCGKAALIDAVDYPKSVDINGVFIADMRGLLNIIHPLKRTMPYT